MFSYVKQDAAIADLGILSALKPGERGFDSGEVHFAMIDALGSVLLLFFDCLYIF
ncbi:hypothetical protein BC832DRAFT_566728 [Gaertneriomyces semiglobifer]|nr:hypothetical protein BC832DRAFT_566728 [Gaertneriomyces semiglobifer]